MKNKNIKIWIPVIVCMAGMLIFAAACCLLGFVFSDQITDWFEQRYIAKVYVPGNDDYNVSMEILWTEIGRLVRGILFFGILFLSIAVYLTAYFYGKGKKRETITEASSMIHDFLQSVTLQTEAANIFPKEYAEISAQMLEIRSGVQSREQLLREESERKNDLIAYLAHDLKTPLTSVIGYLSFLEEMPELTQKQRAKYTHISLEKAKRLEQLINEFFEITRYNLHQMRLEQQEIDLNFMLVQLADEFYPLLKNHGNTVELRIEENTVIVGDAFKLARVFNNILKNAIAYSYADTPIKIWMRQVESKCQIFFENAGETIPSEKLTRIFEKFFRVDDARSSKTGGTGLGLAIAREIVTLHGGEITAESENEKTVFCVVLPVKAGKNDGNS